MAGHRASAFSSTIQKEHEMNNTKFSLRTADALILPAADADALLRLADGDCALLYLHLLRSGGVLEEKAAVESLRISPERLRLAADKLRREGLLGESAKILAPAEELPEYTAEELAVRSREDKNWSALLQETQRIMGKVLNRPELNTLYGIYDRLGMSTETIILLINRVAENLRRRHGEGRSPTMYAIEREAYAWARREILTLDAAMAYLEELDRHEAREKTLMNIVPLGDRKPSSTERHFLESWSAMGFPTEVYELAYDRTVSQIGKFHWKYMDTILRSWQEKKLNSVAEIEKGDTRASGGRSSFRRGNGAQSPPEDTGAERDDLAAFMEMLRKK